MLFVALFIAFVVAQEDHFVELVEEHLIGASYNEEHDRHRNLFHVERLDEKTFGIDGVLQARLFQNSEDDVFIGTSMYNNYVTYLGAQPVLKWEVDDHGDDDSWSEVSTHPTVRPSTLDGQSAVNYFNTADGNTWAYDALYAIQNNTVRRTSLIGGNGTSYIFKLEGDAFSATPSFSYFTNFSTSRSAYFQTGDGREFLWTFSWGPGAPPAPVPGARTPIISDNRATNPQRCTLIEYKSGTWNVQDDRFIGCPTRPRSPISFENVNGNWIYLFPSFGGGGVLTLNYRPGQTPQWEATTDILDNFGIPDADTLYHWVDESDLGTYDMITATTPSSVRTYRLHWDTHFVEELPAVPIAQGSPYDLSWFEPAGRRCFVVGSATYPGLRDITPDAIHAYYTSIYCWDQSRDVWDLAIKFPAEWCWFNQVFTDPEDDEGDAFYLVTMHRAHLTSVSVKTYHIEVKDDDDIHIEFWEGPSVSYSEQARRDAHENRHISIATVSLVAFTLLLVLIMLFLSMSHGGGGGSGDYASFNN